MTEVFAGFLMGYRTREENEDWGEWDYMRGRSSSTQPMIYSTKSKALGATGLDGWRITEEGVEESDQDQHWLPKFIEYKVFPVSVSVREEAELEA